jgi:hypothetical protein
VLLSEVATSELDVIGKGPGTSRDNAIKGLTVVRSKDVQQEAARYPGSLIQILGLRGVVHLVKNSGYGRTIASRLYNHRVATGDVT